MIRFSVSTELYPGSSSLGETADHLGEVTRHAVDIRQLEDAPGAYSADFAALGDLLFADVKASGVAMRAAARRDSGDYALLYFMRDGARRMEQGGRDVRLAAGGCAMQVGDHPVSVWTHQESYFGLMIPRHNFSDLIDSEDHLVCRNVIDQPSTSAILGHYLAAVLGGPTPSDPQSRETIRRHLIELAALVVDGGRRARDATHDDALPAARLLAAKRYIEQRLADPDLDAERIAARLGISAAYVRKLFEHDGVPTARYIRELRLTRAARLLSSPDMREVKVIDIALSCGFNDISSFNRAFRRRFAMTPSDARHMIRRHR